jgi:hypothetical protein
MANPSSALGPGFALSVKPDILMPGSRERLRVIRSHGYIEVTPAGASRSAGLKVAAPPKGGREELMASPAVPARPPPWHRVQRTAFTTRLRRRMVKPSSP